MPLRTRYVRVQQTQNDERICHHQKLREALSPTLQSKIESQCRFSLKCKQRTVPSSFEEGEQSAAPALNTPSKSPEDKNAPTFMAHRSCKTMVNFWSLYRRATFLGTVQTLVHFNGTGV